jgi:HKD family nuclease
MDSSTSLKAKAELNGAKAMQTPKNNFFITVSFITDDSITVLVDRLNVRTERRGRQWFSGHSAE